MFTDSVRFFSRGGNEDGVGSLTSIDPYEESVWHGVALALVQAIGANANFRIWRGRKHRYDVIFIDGNHGFDDGLTDFYLYASLCADRGFVIFDELWMPSIQSAASFVRANRTDFEEHSTGEFNVAVFQKMGNDSRRWDHFQRFGVTRG